MMRRRRVMRWLRMKRGCRFVMLAYMMRRRSMVRWGWMMSCMVRRRGRPVIKTTQNSIPVRTQASDQTCPLHFFVLTPVL